MWDWLNCHLAGRHEYAVWSDSNRMFLRCLRCGRRSNGWEIAASQDGTDDHVPGSGTRDARLYRRGLIAGALSLVGLSLIGRLPPNGPVVPDPRLTLSKSGRDNTACPSRGFPRKS